MWDFTVDAAPDDDVAALVAKAHADARDKYPGASRDSMVAIEPRMKLVAKHAAALAKGFGGSVRVTVGGSDIASEGMTIPLADGQTSRPQPAILSITIYKEV